MIIEHVIIEFVSLGKNSSPDKFETWQIVNVSEIRATSYTELRTCDHYISKHSHWWKRWSLCKFASHYAWGTNGVCQRKMDVKPTHIPTCHQIDNVFMVTWTIFKNCLLEVGLTQPWDTMALWTLTTVVDSIYHVGGPAWIEFLEIAFGWGPGHIRLHTTLKGLWPHYIHDFGGVLGWPLDTFFLDSHKVMVTALGSCVKWP